MSECQKIHTLLNGIWYLVFNLTEYFKAILNASPMTTPQRYVTLPNTLG